MHRCSTCGNEYPSRYHFVTDSLCNQCFEKVGEEEKKPILERAESLSKEGASERFINAHKLVCPICGHDQFWKRQTLLNTPGMTFFGIEWANKQADNYVCNSCGHILWFMKD